MSKIVNGASLQPLSGGSPKHVVLLLHGYGSNGADLIAMAQHWRQELPDTLFLAPNAPQNCAAGSGYQWWPLQSFMPQALATGADALEKAIALAAHPDFFERHAELLAAVEQATHHESWQQTLKQNRWEASWLSGKDLSEFLELDLTTARVMVYLLKLKA